MLSAWLVLQPLSAFAADQNARDEAAAISQVAAGKAKDGEFGLCASLYHQAYRTDPSFLGYLYSAARCEQKAGDLDAAEKHYREFLARTTPDDPLRERAQDNLKEIYEVRKQAPPPTDKPPADKPDQPPPDQPPPPDKPPTEPPVVPPPERPMLGYVAVGVGAVAVATGGWLVASGLGDRSQLEDDLKRDPKGLILKLSPAQAHERESSYQTSIALGTAAVGVGAVMAGLGTWLLLREPQAPEVSVDLRPEGARVALTLRWR